MRQEDFVIVMGLLEIHIIAQSDDLLQVTFG